MKDKCINDGLNVSEVNKESMLNSLNFVLKSCGDLYDTQSIYLFVNFTFFWNLGTNDNSYNTTAIKVRKNILKKKKTVPNGIENVTAIPTVYNNVSHDFLQTSFYCCPENLLQQFFLGVCVYSDCTMADFLLKRGVTKDSRTIG